MTSPAEDTSTLHYSENNNTTVSVRIGQQKGHNHNTASKDNNTTQDDSSTDGGGQYFERDICMVVHTSSYL